MLKFFLLGSAVVLLTACGGGDDSPTVSDNGDVISNTPPTAIATATPTSTIEGEVISFDASSSDDVDGDILRYQWKEGEILLSDELSFTKEDFTVGEHNITLVVTDDSGVRDEDNIKIIIVKETSKLASLNGKTLEEFEHWKVKITVDSLIINQKSAIISFRALSCDGDLTYTGQKNGGYLFNQKITYGNCIQDCIMWIKADGSKYEETCPNNIETGNLVIVDNN